MDYCTIYDDDGLSGAAGKALRLQSAMPTPTPPVTAPPTATAPGIVVDPAGDWVWQIEGYPSKEAWRLAGKKPLPASYVPPTPVVVPVAAGSPSITLPAGTPGAAPAGGGLSSLLSGIPTTYLYIGGALLLFMMMKKR